MWSRVSGKNKNSCHRLFVFGSWAGFCLFFLSCREIPNANCRSRWFSQVCLFFLLQCYTTRQNMAHTQPRISIGSCSAQLESKHQNLPCDCVRVFHFSSDTCTFNNIRNTQAHALRSRCRLATLPLLLLTCARPSQWQMPPSPMIPSHDRSPHYNSTIAI